MRFLLDESADARIIPHLTELGHDVQRIARDFPFGLPDVEVLRIAYESRRILIAHDLGFGELVFVRRQPHAGVILLRLGPSAPIAATIARLDYMLAHHVSDLDAFVVVTRDLVRVRR